MTAAGAALMGGWWATVWLLVWLAGEHAWDTQVATRIAAAAGAIAMLATIPVARLLLRGAYASESLAVVMIPLGLAGMHVLLPGTFIIHVF
jgi:hypothetical protein